MRMCFFSVPIQRQLPKFYMQLHGFVENSLRKMEKESENLFGIFSFFRYLKDPRKTLESMLNTKITLFPGHIQSVYYQNILKVLTFLIQSSADEDFLHQPLVSMTIEKMNSFLSSGDVEAQERVC